MTRMEGDDFMPAGAVETASPGHRRSGPLGGQRTTRSGERGG